MEKSKTFLKNRLGLGLVRLIADHKKKAKENKEKGIEDLSLVKSLRGLESSSGISYRILQGISKGERSPEYLTLEAIADAFGIPLSTFLSYCEALSDSEVQQAMEKNKKAKNKKKKP
ncbi:hypothetical protein HF329_00745 [Chitinophaga oryzae]|uniref:HTH cro/C1-type domain-containing protein n=1 Tax=Chitinophaga oryzae TaxID=2725414 RepID=A0AAE7D6C5_9BACT|nr:hypothetical protein [Chitinophaga oryzae]QJB29911.1 hypothetical protein HF329_00745 [Chitinophaga oryzae]